VGIIGNKDLEDVARERLTRGFVARCRVSEGA